MSSCYVSKVSVQAMPLNMEMDKEVGLNHFSSVHRADLTEI